MNKVAVLIFQLSSCALLAAGGNIKNPSLIFDFPDKLTPLESCILDEVVQQSPHDLSEVLSAGNVGLGMESSTGKIQKSVAAMEIVAITHSEKYIAYALKFMAAANHEWHLYSGGPMNGAYTEEMIPVVNIEHTKTGALLFTVDISHCSKGI